VAAADSPFGDLWSDDDDTDDAEDPTLTERLEETIDMARSWGVGVGGGLADRVSYEASQSTPWADPPNLSAEATDTRETINGNSTQIVDYLNNQTDAANASVDNTTVHELRLVDEDHAPGVHLPRVRVRPDDGPVDDSHGPRELQRLGRLRAPI